MYQSGIFLAVENNAEHTEIVIDSASQPATATALTVADEPQNELTKKFTEDEWKGIEALRVSYTNLTAHMQTFVSDISNSSDFLKLQKRYTRTRANP